MGFLNSKQNIQTTVLGTKQTGKTTIITGMYLAAREQGKEIYSSPSLQKLLDRSYFDQQFPSQTNENKIQQY